MELFLKTIPEQNQMSKIHHNNTNRLLFEFIEYCLSGYHIKYLKLIEYSNKHQAMNILTSTITRILFAIRILISGLLHIRSAKQMSEIVVKPGGIYHIYLTGFATMLAGIRF